MSTRHWKRTDEHSPGDPSERLECVELSAIRIVEANNVRVNDLAPSVLEDVLTCSRVPLQAQP